MKIKYAIKSIFSLKLLALTALLVSCGEAKKEPFNTNFEDSNSSGGKYLYVVSGGCYGGGATLSVGSATVARYYKKTGLFDRVLVDYGSIAAGDMPVELLIKMSTRY